MKINKYLKALGYTKWDMPGYYNPRGVDMRNADKPGADMRNKEDAEGFCEYEFFSLDHTLSMYIYSKLCWYREHILPLGCTPGHLAYQSWNNSEESRKEYSDKAYQKWKDIVDKMILAFELQLRKEKDSLSGIEMVEVQEGLHLFAEYFNCLWF